MKNIHQELNGEDLSNLFETVAPVEFIKFDPKKDSIAYVCFQYNFASNNSEAISKFDGRKAMGKILIVENATSLAERIAIVPPDRSHPYARASRGSSGPNPRNSRNDRNPRVRPPRRAPKPQKKSAEELDNELNAYMSGKSDEQLREEARVNKLDNEMDNYWKETGDQTATSEPVNGTTEAPAPAEAPAPTEDSMNVD